MSVTSDEVNFLVYRYLQESGFTHSSFTFAYESLVTKSSVTASDLPPGALISLLQKGLQYVEIEAHLNEDGTKRDMPDPFALLMPYAVRKRARMEKSTDDTDSSSSSSSSTVAKKATVVRRDEVTMLRGHSSEVFICSWNPKFELLASGSKDSTARIWGIPHGASGMASGEVASLHPQVLAHGGESSSSGGAGEGAEGDAGHKDVTTLDWNPSGKLLATGTFDGQARIWNQEGKLISTLKEHTGPIFSLKWNKSGSALLSGSVDKTAIIWDPINGTVKQQFKFHSDPTLDVDWRDDETFATCSTDKMIHVCQLGSEKPIKTFSGHVDEVNAIKWSPCGKMLASCSDDNTTKIWSLDAPGNGLVHDFTDHDKEVYTIQWSPTGPGSANPNQKLVLASASFDSTIRIWDPETGTCLHSLVKHTHPVYSVSFSPDGQFLASGAFDKCLHIWSVKDGSLVKTYNGPGGIFDVCWNASGTKVAAGFSDNSVACFDTLDLRM